MALNPRWPRVPLCADGSRRVCRSSVTNMIRCALATSFILLLMALVASAHVVELKNGQRIEGNLKVATSDRIVVEVGGQDIILQADRVRAIYFGAGPEATPQADGCNLKMEMLNLYNAVNRMRAAAISASGRTVGVERPEERAEQTAARNEYRNVSSRVKALCDQRLTEGSTHKTFYSDLVTCGGCPARY